MRVQSIRRRLLLFHVVFALLLLSVASLVTYWVALEHANQAYDRSLLDPAFDIADNLRIDAEGAHVDLPTKALEALVYDKTDKVIFQVRSASSAILDGAIDLALPPSVKPEQYLYFDGLYQGEKYRFVAVGTSNGQVIQVGETLHKRARLVSEIMYADLAPTLLVALVSIALAWVGMGRSLMPLDRVRTDLMSRTPEDLRPIRDKSNSVEIAPVIGAFNRNLAHMRDANMLQQRFLGNAAHQLRTPLAGLQLHLELLFRQQLPTDLRAELEAMHSATVRISRLVNQLLALAKVESAPEQGRDLEVIDLRTVAEVAARDWAPLAYNRKIDLGFELASAPMLSDALLLPELVNNLIDNALRYTPPGGTVTVRTGIEHDIPYLTVEDTGPGIASSERDKVRERFYRIAGSPGEGSGLGLAIVKEVVDRHRGFLEIYAGEVGGTCVRVSFPQKSELHAQK